MASPSWGVKNYYDSVPSIFSTHASIANSGSICTRPPLLPMMAKPLGGEGDSVAVGSGGTIQ